MHMPTQISWPVIVAVCLGGSAALLANVISFMMIDKLNQRLPENERISYFWWGTEVRKRFRQLYPGNSLVLLLDSCVVLMILCFVFLIKFWVF